MYWAHLIRRCRCYKTGLSRYSILDIFDMGAVLHVIIGSDSLCGFAKGMGIMDLDNGLFKWM